MLTLRRLLDDGLVELDAIEIGVVLHVRAEYHVLVEVAGVEERRGEPSLADVVVDVVFAWTTRSISVPARGGANERSTTFVDARDEATTGDMPRARERAPHEALHGIFERRIDEVLALLLLASRVVLNCLLGGTIRWWPDRGHSIYQYAPSRRSSSRRRRPSTHAERPAPQRGW